MLNRFSFHALFLLLLFAAPSVLAQTGEAGAIKKMLTDRDKQVKALLGTKKTFTADQRTRLQTVINDVIDFEAMSRAALGAEWAKLSAQQQKDFVTAFAGVVRAQSLADLDVYRATVQYGEVKVNGAAATARTTTTHNGTTATVIYALQKKGSAWLVTDITINDVSTVQGYAKSFQPVLKRKNGYDTLMRSLNKKLEKLNNT